jgi:cell division protein FtsN
MAVATPKPLSYLKDKDPTTKSVALASWIKKNGGPDIDPKHIMYALRADGLFQKSDENQAALARRREELEQEKLDREARREERATKAAERAAAREERAKSQAEKNANKSDTPPVKKAAAKAAPVKVTKAAAKAPATKAATKAPASKPAAKKAPAKRGAKAAEFDSTDF